MDKSLRKITLEIFSSHPLAMVHWVSLLLIDALTEAQCVPFNPSDEYEKSEWKEGEEE